MKRFLIAAALLAMPVKASAWVTASQDADTGKWSCIDVSKAFGSDGFIASPNKLMAYLKSQGATYTMSDVNGYIGVNYTARDGAEGSQQYFPSMADCNAAIGLLQ